MRNSVKDILAAREEKLLKRINEIKKELDALEAEFNDCRLAIAAIETKEPQFQLTRGSHQVPPRSPYASLTMKDLVRKALKEVFPQGATAQQLLDVFRSQWGRTDVERASLSPQLSRLKYPDREIELHGTVWKLRPPTQVLVDPNEVAAPKEDATKTEAGDKPAPVNPFD